MRLSQFLCLFLFWKYKQKIIGVITKVLKIIHSIFYKNKLDLKFI